jgi:hypothetical protein
MWYDPGATDREPLVATTKIKGDRLSEARQTRKGIDLAE